MRRLSQTATRYTLLGAGVDAIDRNVKLSYYNEYLAGVEYQLLFAPSTPARTTPLTQTA